MLFAMLTQGVCVLSWFSSASVHPCSGSCRFSHHFLIHDWLPTDKSNARYVELHPYCASKAALVEFMAKKLNSPHHTVTMDNYFTSCAAFRALRALGMHAVGTLRANSDVPRSVLWNKRNAGKAPASARFQRTTDRILLLQEWQDRGLVRVLSTGHVGFNGRPASYSNKPGVVSIIRKDASGREHSVPCPPAVHHYQHHMGGVDRADQVSCTCVRWRLSLVFKLMICTET